MELTGYFSELDLARDVELERSPVEIGVGEVAEPQLGGFEGCKKHKKLEGLDEAVVVGVISVIFCEYAVVERLRVVGNLSGENTVLAIEEPVFIELRGDLAIATGIFKPSGEAV